MTETIIMIMIIIIIIIIIITIYSQFLYMVAIHVIVNTN